MALPSHAIYKAHADEIKIILTFSADIFTSDKINIDGRELKFLADSGIITRGLLNDDRIRVFSMSKHQRQRAEKYVMDV